MNGKENKRNGNEFELLTAKMLRSLGYDAKLINKNRGDYGVDIIALSPKGIKIAIQCKSHTIRHNTGIDSVQEVYAGGRYYGLEHFAVVSDTGFTNSAEKMAAKLGVYLSYSGVFNYPDDIGKYANSILITHNETPVKNGFEINGQIKTLNQWCNIYNADPHHVKAAIRRGLRIEDALQWKPAKHYKRYTVDGFTGSIPELCDHFGVSPQFIYYRRKQGMTLEEAFLTPKLQCGRPLIKNFLDSEHET